MRSHRSSVEFKAKSLPIYNYVGKNGLYNILLNCKHLQICYANDLQSFFPVPAALAEWNYIFNTHETVLFTQPPLVAIIARKLGRGRKPRRDSFPLD